MDLKNRIRANLLRYIWIYFFKYLWRISTCKKENEYFITFITSGTRFIHLRRKILEALVEIIQDKSLGAIWIYNYYAFFARNNKLLNFNTSPIDSNIVNDQVK